MYLTRPLSSVTCTRSRIGLISPLSIFFKRSPLRASLKRSERQEKRRLITSQQVCRNLRRQCLTGILYLFSANITSYDVRTSNNLQLLNDVLMDNIQLSSRGEVKWWVYISRCEASSYISRAMNRLRVVLVF